MALRPAYDHLLEVGFAADFESLSVAPGGFGPIAILYRIVFGMLLPLDGSGPCGSPPGFVDFAP